MGRWSKWIPIDEAAAPGGRFASKFGLYQIRAVGRSGRPLRIPRLAAVDASGLLYIGRSGHKGRSPNRTIANRLREFLKEHHSGGKTYAKAAAVLRRMGRFSGHVLEVSGVGLSDGQINRHETVQLRRYFKAYGELPPCNSSLPNMEVIDGMRMARKRKR